MLKVICLKYFIEVFQLHFIFLEAEEVKYQVNKCLKHKMNSGNVYCMIPAPFKCIFLKLVTYHFA